MKKAIAILIVAMTVLTVWAWPQFSFPFCQNRQFSYKDALVYAQEIDPDAEVEKKSFEISYEGKTCKAWNAVIYNRNCKVASIPEKAYGKSRLGILNRRFTKDVYHLESDYSYIIVGETLKDYPELGTLTSSSEFGAEIVSEVSVTNENEIDRLWKSYVAARKTISEKNTPRLYFVDVKKGDELIKFFPVADTWK